MSDMEKTRWLVCLSRVVLLEQVMVNEWWQAVFYLPRESKKKKKGSTKD